MEPKRSKRGTWAMIAFSGLIGLGIVAVMFMFPRCGNHQELITLLTQKQAGADRLILLYQETSYSEQTSTYLVGYELQCVEAASKQVLDKIFLKRYQESYWARPLLLDAGNGEFWVVQAQQQIQGDTGFTASVKLGPDGKFTEMPKPEVLQGHAVKGVIGDRYLHLVNTYNEGFCFDLQTRTRLADCPWVTAQAPEGIYRFFTVPKEPGSTRSKVWYFEPGPSLAAPEIVAGTGDDLGAGVILQSRLASSTSGIAEFELVHYQSRLKPEEGRLIPIALPDYVLNPWILYQDSTQAVMMHGDAAKGSLSFFCADRSGRLRWQLTRPQTPEAGHPMDIRCRWTPAETQIMSPANWAFCVDNVTGKLRWEWP